MKIKQIVLNTIVKTIKNSQRGFAVIPLRLNDYSAKTPLERKTTNYQ